MKDKKAKFRKKNTGTTKYSSGSFKSKKKNISSTPEYNLNKVKKSKRSGPSLKDGIRLNKYIADSGICSRRDADELIKAGYIAVNGKTVKEMGTKVFYNDKVTYNGKPLSREKLIYVLLNKPKDYLSTVTDPHERKTVLRLIDNACNERVYPVGRLDRGTTGLLLLTNDGDLTKKLTHPSYKVKKIYQAELNKPLNQEDADKVVSGVELEDGIAYFDTMAFLSDDRKSLGIELHSGKNRIIRRIFEKLGYEVVKLDRTVFAGLDKKDLPRGKWRYLNEKEVIKLKHLS